MNGLLDKVRCSVHHGKRPNYLSIDKKTFQVVCTLCLEEGVTPKRKNLVMLDQSEKEEDWRHCATHDTEEALFYCEDCAMFICKTCFATIHRNHSCSTPELIVNTIKDNLTKLYNQLNDLKNKLEKSNEEVQSMNTFYNTQKENFKASLEGIKQRIGKALNDKATEYNNQIESFFNGVDHEVELSVQKLDNTRKKASRMLEEFSQMKKEVSAIDSDKKVCLYKKEKDSTIEDNKHFLEDIENFLQENLSKTKQKVINEEDSFITKCNNFTKGISSYENSVINTIVSGIPNVCMRIRRFRRYTNAKSKYFKTDSLCLLTSNSVNLAGFSLCGLIHDKSDPSMTYKVQLKIYELDNVQQYDPHSTPLTSIEVEIPSITNMVDPVYQFYLKNSVTISKNKLYYIIITNLSNMTFVNTWTGAVDKEIEEHINQHSVICNNSNVKFNFLSTFGVESDFNEFSEGIISDIIFSQID